MKVTKLVHSCLLIKTDEAVVLCDPGQYSWEAGLLEPAFDQLAALDYVVMTHEHADHFYMPAIAKIVTRFPSVKIITTETVKTSLAAAAITQVSSESDGPVEIFSKELHARVPLGATPANIAVHIAGQLTDPGDRHDIEETRKVLALPVTAPWGSMLEAVDLALRLKPKYVLPIHDWHWHDQARTGAYQALETIFSAQGIAFIKLENGVEVEIAD